MSSGKSLKLCLVTHRGQQSFLDYQSFLLKSIQGGVTSIQLRDKQSTSQELYEMAIALKALLTPLNIPLIINDHLEIAYAAKADGVHLGQKDASPWDARARLGENAIIGLSIESLDELKCANQMNCLNYVAASAVFESQTKSNCHMIWGLDGLKQICEQSYHPVVAIGGIERHNTADVMRCGVTGIAVVSAIHQANCPESAAAELVQCMENIDE